MKVYGSLALVLTLVQCTTMSYAQEIYCEPKECYSVLGVARDASLAKIKRAYRKLAKEYHPDTSTVANAEQLFREVATAMEVLTDEEERAEYDYYLEHPEEAFYNKMRYYRRRYAPKSDPVRVVTVFCLFVSGLQYFLQLGMYKKALSYYVKNDKKFRQKVKRLAYEELQQKSNGVNGSASSAKGKKKKKEKEQKEELVAIEARITEELAKQVHVSGGYKHPEVKNLLAVKIVMLPYTLPKYIVWKLDWIYRHDIKGEPLSEEEKLYLLASIYSTTVDELYDQFDQNEVVEMMEKEVWVHENKQKFEDEQFMKKHPGRYKQWMRYKKNHAD